MRVPLVVARHARSWPSRRPPLSSRAHTSTSRWRWPVRMTASWCRARRRASGWVQAASVGRGRERIVDDDAHGRVWEFAWGRGVGAGVGMWRGSAGSCGNMSPAARRRSICSSDSRNVRGLCSGRYDKHSDGIPAPTPRVAGGRASRHHASRPTGAPPQSRRERCRIAAHTSHGHTIRTHIVCRHKCGDGGSGQRSEDGGEAHGGGRRFGRRRGVCG